MLVKLAESIGRLVLSGRELTKLSGLTMRVTELTTVLKDLNEGKYTRSMVNENSNGHNADGNITRFLIIY